MLPFLFLCTVKYWFVLTLKYFLNSVDFNYIFIYNYNMGKLPKIISIFLAIIFIFSGCTEKYDIVDHKDYASTLSENDAFGGESGLYSDDNIDFSSIVSYDELISGDFSSLDGFSSDLENTTTSSGNYFVSSEEITSEDGSSFINQTTTIPTTTTEPSTTTSPSTTEPPTTTSPVTTKPTTTTSSPTSSNSGSYTPTYYSNMKAVWLSYYEFYYDIKYNNATTFRTYAKGIMQKIKGFGFNTVIVHLRSHGDAIFESAYFPWSNIVGKDPEYDPTQILIEEAHAQGLSFHAWFNPLRLSTPANLAKVDNKYLTKQWYNTKYGDYVVKSGSYCYLNPAYTDVRVLIVNGAKEIAQKYKVDAIHIDDYFYPTTSASFDDKAYSALGGGKTLADFRRMNINVLVKGIYNAIKNINSKIKFGISPGGNVERNYNELYADTTLWLQSGGYMDYCIPQLYWNYEHKTHDYKKVLNQWNSLATNKNVDLIIGLGYYKVNNSEYNNSTEGDEWTEDYTVIARQVKDAKSTLGSKYRGFSIFDYDSLFNKNTSLHQKAREELKKVM